MTAFNFETSSQLGFTLHNSLCFFDSSPSKANLLVLFCLFHISSTKSVVLPEVRNREMLHTSLVASICFVDTTQVFDHFPQSSVSRVFERRKTALTSHTQTFLSQSKGYLNSCAPNELLMSDRVRLLQLTNCKKYQSAEDFKSEATKSKKKSCASKQQLAVNSYEAMLDLLDAKRARRGNCISN